MKGEDLLKSYTYAFVGMLLWGIAPIFAKLGLSKVEPVIGLFMRSVVITTLLVGWVLASGQMGKLADVTGRDWLFLGLEGIFASLLGHLAYYLALKYGEVSVVSPIMAGFPVVTALIAVMFLGERFTLIKLGGVIFILLGVFLLKR